MHITNQLLSQKFYMECAINSSPFPSTNTTNINMAERRCRPQMRREVFRTLRMNAKSMIRRWEKEFNEFNEFAKMKRRRAHHGKDREMMKHAISREVFEFIKTKDILHELIHPHSNGKENIPRLPIIGSQTQVMPRPPRRISLWTPC